MADVTIRRQSHGIKARTVNITISAGEFVRLQREAERQQISLSRHIVNLIRFAWAMREALPQHDPTSTEPQP